MREKKRILILIMFLIIISTVNAIVINNAKPTITATTDEPSSIVSYSLTDELDNTITVDYTQVSNTEFQFTPQTNLPEGDYEFSITLKDEFENTNTELITFTIEYGTLTIQLINPENSYTSTKEFDFKIQTNRDAYCKYDNYGLSFENMQAFATTNNVEHTITNYKLDTNSKYTVYVKCKDSFKDETIPKTFTLYYDNSAPIVTEKYAQPDMVVETPLKTKFFVKTNEDAKCKYSMDKTNYDEMQYLFQDTFAKDHEKEILLPENPTGTYTYHIKCKNKAGLVSTTDNTITVKVDLSAELKIYVNTPTTLSTTTVNLNITTNKQAECLYGNESDNYQYSFTTTDSLHHKATLSLKTGSFTYYIYCVKGAESDTETITFTIDTTAPKMISVEEIGYGNISGKTYKTDKLRGKWQAEDNESGIAEYNVSLYLDNQYSSDELIESFITTNTEYELEDLELNDSEEYYFEVKAKNNVNLWSTTKKGSGITVDTSSTPASCSNNKKDSNEMGIDCGGVCSRGCSLNTTCDEDSDCLSKFCNPDNDKCDTPTCDDDIKNGKESDVDCGGNCSKKCKIGKNCNDDDDCESGECDISDGVCIGANTCSNRRLDSGETDIDCGGTCLTKCDNSKKCDIDPDCRSGYCIDNICAEANTCYNNQKDVGETDIDCGSNCNPCRAGQDCITDPDCLSQNCQNNICAGVTDDKDNDGLPDDWEDENNEGDLDSNSFDTDNDGTSDADEDFDDDGLPNVMEYKYGTNPHKKDTDGDGYTDKEEIDKGTNPTDRDDYPQSSFMLILFILLILILLAAGAYFGYKKIKERKKESKQEIPPIEEEKIPEIKPTPPMKKTQPKRILTPPFITKSEKKRKEKQRKISSLFDKFRFGESIKKQTIKKERIEPTYSEEEGPKIGWVELKAPTKKLKEQEYEKISDVFKILPKIKSEKVQGYLPAEEAFSSLSKMIGPGVKPTIVKEFRDVAARKKLTKEELINLINKFSKEKKMDEDTLHKILVSILDEKKTPLKKKKKEKLPTIIKKETKKKSTKRRKRKKIKNKKKNGF